MSERRADVVVVGARAAGAATALLLARAGLAVTVVDRDRPGTDTLSTHALMRGGVALLSRWGVLDQIVRAGTPPIRTTTFHYATGQVSLPIKPSPGVDALYAPRRTVLDPALVQAAEQAGATVLWRTTALGLRWKAGRVVGLDTRDQQGRLQPMTAGLVIGADGRRSTVARLVGAATTHRAAHTTAFAYGYFTGGLATGYEWAYRPHALAGFIPTNDGLTCVFVGGSPQRIGRGGLTTLRDALAEASPALAQRLGSSIPVSPIRTFTGQPGRLLQPWGQGWALVGDAGSWKDPISAHGLTDALRDAEQLSRAATAVLADGRDPEDAFGEYQAGRDRLTLPILRGSDEIAAFAWDDQRIAALLLELNAAMGEEVLAIEAVGATPDRLSG